VNWLAGFIRPHVEHDLGAYSTSRCARFARLSASFCALRHFRQTKGDTGSTPALFLTSSFTAFGFWQTEQHRFAGLGFPVSAPVVIPAGRLVRVATDAEPNR
jgi:hypothetical protein